MSFDKNIELILTGDGSPTARHLFNSIPGEAMHHTDGALSETLYIYGPAIDFAFKNQNVPQILSVGLGLGYNELLTMAHSLKSQRPFQMESLESDVNLQSAFMEFLDGAGYEHYELILKGIANASAVEPMAIRNGLKNALLKKTWVLNGPLNEKTRFTKTFHAILYDLYSSNTVAELWTEEFLTDFVQRAADPNCVFATYAAKGNLRRALESNGFKVERKIGFSGKSESIFAFRT